MKIIAIIFGVFFLFGCSPAYKGTRAPDFYPNEHLEKVGRRQANNDARYCMSLADDYVKQPNAYQEGAKNVTKAAVAGTAAGAVGGAIMGGSYGRYTAAGAATGAIVQLLREMNKAGEKSPGWEKFVEKCLENKGYQVYDWS